MQTILGPKGNCFAACIASLLELDVENVPNFCAEEPEGWMLRCCAWLRGRGYGALLMEYGQLKAGGGLAFFDGSLLIAGGNTTRFPDVLHAVLWRDGELVHDPHPDGTGIVGEPVDLTLIFRLEVAP